LIIGSESYGSGQLLGSLTLAGLAPAAGAALPAPALAGVVPPPDGAIVVGAADGPTCPQPAYSTIQAAVTAAPDNATVYVCAGAYAEDVTIDKPLTLLGARWGVDARTERTDTSAETIWSPGQSGKDAAAYAGAMTGTIDGFTFSGGDTSSAIHVITAGDGYTWRNNIITHQATGIGLATPGGTGTLITHNRFSDIRKSKTGAIVLAAGTSNAVTITENSFINVPAGGVNSISAGTRDLTVTDNTFANDPGVGGNFAVIFRTNGTTISGNTFTGGTSTAVFIGGDNIGATVNNNTISDAPATGINVSSAADPQDGPPQQLTIANNTIIGRSNGISYSYAGSGSGSTITGNQVTGSTADGITVANASVAGLTLTDNVVRNSTGDDCRDASADSTWTHNIGPKSSPVHLCSPPVQATLTVTVAATSAVAGEAISVTVDVAGTDDFPHTLTWKLLGPVHAGSRAPRATANSSCASANYTNAPVFASGVNEVTGDGDVTISHPVGPAGCYTYQAALVGLASIAPATIAAGSSATTFGARSPVAGGNPGPPSAPGTPQESLPNTGYATVRLVGAGLILAVVGAALVIRTGATSSRLGRLNTRSPAVGAASADARPGRR
jgi:hypothetical protein